MQAELYWIADVHRGRLAIMPRPRAGDWLADELASLHSSGVDILVSLLTDEEIAELDLEHEPSECQKLRLSFITYPINDREVPSSIENFLNLTNYLDKRLRDGDSIAIHCRMGIGRSSLLAASLLVKSGLSTADAFISISRARGIDVPDTVMQVDWVESIQERLRNN